jgi:hypothetical protein
MINRRALWISLLVLIAMIAADVWRLSLLPDWHHIPAEGPGNSHTIPVLALFAPVLALLFTMGILFARRWLRSGPEDAVQPWRRWYGLMLLFNTAIAASAQAFNLARSMGALQSVNRLTLSHGVMVVGGIFMILVGNMLPKMPFLSQRFRPLDQWQWNQHLRFGGKVTVVFGVFIALVLPLLPFRMVLPVTLGLGLMVIAVNYWHRAKVRREPSPQSQP